MSFQIKNFIKYNNENYEFLNFSNKINLDFSKYNIEPSSFTLCYRGYICSYIIEDNTILIKDLDIKSKNNNYPEINNTFATANSNDGPRMYKNINLKLGYTGNIIIGKDTIREFSELFFAQDFAYKTVIELQIVNDKIINVIDHSKVVEGIRNSIRNYALTHKKELYEKPRKPYILPEFTFPQLLDEEYYIQQVLKQYHIVVDIKKQFAKDLGIDYWWLK